MKREYVKPVFVVEEYEFSSSIAKCAIDIDTTEPLTLVCGETNLCAKDGEDGHRYGAANGKGCNNKGVLHELYGHKTPTTIFNDGAADACHYDWDGRKNQVAQANNATFAAAFYGNEANQELHAPGYKGAAFLS